MLLACKFTQKKTKKQTADTQRIAKTRARTV